MTKIIKNNKIKLRFVLFFLKGGCMQGIFDVAVIGGGVVGACIFDDLSLSGYNAVLIEKELDVSTGASKANSALIHAGFDAKPNTLKAKFNVEGNAMYPAICDRLGLKLNKCGAYVVGDNPDMIKELILRGKTNGVKGLKALNNSQLKKVLPNITDNITCGLFAENAYIINPYLLTICLAEEGVVNGGKVELNFDTTKVIKHKEYFEIISKNNTIFAKAVVNSAGAGYNDVAKLLGTETYDIKYRRGEYYVLDNSEYEVVKSTVFPLPTKAGKGVLVTPTVDGNVLVGPTSYESDNSTVTTTEGLQDIRNKVSTMLNNINLSKTIRVFSGVRTIVGDDFVIEKSKKVNGVVNIAGICSPGLSSAPAISKYVINELLALKYNHNPKSKKIKPYFRLQDLSLKEQNKLIKKNSDYGKVICKCEGVSLGEIKDAINRPIIPTTMDGIKRRVRAGMGRCQGGFCNDRVATILSKELNISLYEVKKEHHNSNYIKGDK